MKKVEGNNPKSQVRGPQHPGATSRPASSFILHPSSFTRIPWWLLAVLLGLMTLALYWPARGFDFINCDDPDFVTSNIHVQGGLNWEGVKWAFGLTGGDYWHPLTWLSLMLDVSFFGQGAGGFHFTNMAFHAANGVLLFLLLHILTGALWRSVVVAALFALHPLRVESVAWVTERKDVLSGCFGLLALICYACYAQRRMQSAEGRRQNSAVPNTQHATRFTSHASSLYLLSLGFLACGLMSKAMLVTWPFVMLLLDYWPLGRLDLTTLPALRTTLFRALREKLPFFGLSGVSCVLTYLTEKGRQGAIGSVATPALVRLENALVAYARYLGKIFWPVNLALPYMNPGHWSWLEAGGSVLVIVGVCLIVLWLGRRRPYLLVGWCWFLGTMIPVIGLTQGWGSFMADRFTYVPSIGVLVLTVWGVCELARGWRDRVAVLSVAGGAAIVCCLGLTREQLGHWKNSETLFGHALAVTENNAVAHYNLGNALDKRGQIDEAMGHYEEALRVKRDYADAHNNLGVALDKKGQTDEAIGHYQEVLRLEPDHALAHYNLGVALDKRGQTDEATRQFQEALRVKPDYAEAHENLGIALGHKGQNDEAIRQFQEALRAKPDYADARFNLAVALGQKGQTDEAIRQFQETLRLKPDHAEAHYNLAVALGQKGQIDEAIRQFQETLRLKPEHAEAHYNLAVALGQKGEIGEAIRQLQEAIRLKPDHVQAHNNLGTALYQQGRVGEAIRQFQEALKFRPDYADARRNLEAVLANQAGASSPPGAATNR